MNKAKLITAVLVVLFALAGCGEKELATAETTTTIIPMFVMQTDGHTFKTANLTCNVKLDMDYAFDAPEIIFEGTTSGLGGYVLIIDEVAINGENALESGDIILNDGKFEQAFLCETSTAKDDVNQVKIVFHVKSLRNNAVLYDKQNVIVVME